MKKPILSILIPITPDRKESVQPLLRKIGLGIGLYHFVDDGEWSYSWFTDDGILELRIYQDNKELTIGEKRERLYKQSSGTYSWQVDSDDDIDNNAIELILEAIKNNPDVDCITFEEYCLMNGREFRSNHSLKYEDWADNFDGYDFVRTPFYKDVIRTEIAKSVPFEKIRYGEDHAWARALKPHLKTEVHIPQQLYRYIHESLPNDFDERYGFNTD